MVQTLTAPEVADILPAGRVNPLALVGTDVRQARSGRDALRLGGFDWTCSKVPLLNPLTGEPMGIERPVKDKEGNITGMRREGFFGVVRDDTKACLGVVEGQYEIVQNHDFFPPIADLFLSDGARITRATYLHREQNERLGQLFLHFDWPVDKADAVVGDIVGRTAILRCSHDGKSSAEIMLMLMRLACLNGMIVPVPGLSFTWKICHTISADRRLKDASKAIEASPRYFTQARHACELLAREKVSDALAERLVVSAVDPGNVDSMSEIKPATRTKIDDILGLRTTQPGANTEALRGTAYGLYQAGAEYCDHGIRTKKTQGWSEAQQRFKSAFGGAGATTKMKLWQVIGAEFEVDRRLKSGVN